jgi:hypothetical protein
MSIYTELKAAGVPLDSHESDLYVKATREAVAILKGYEHIVKLATFINRVDGEIWYKIPFAFNPFWERA